MSHPDKPYRSEEISPPVTDDEAERAAMIERRRQFMVTLMDQPLTEETFAAARAANIFMGWVPFFAHEL